MNPAKAEYEALVKSLNKLKLTKDEISFWDAEMRKHHRGRVVNEVCWLPIAMPSHHQGISWEADKLLPTYDPEKYRLRYVWDGREWKLTDDRVVVIR